MSWARKRASQSADGCCWAWSRRAGRGSRQPSRSAGRQVGRSAGRQVGQQLTVGDVPVRITRPVGATGPLPVVLYIHGAGSPMLELCSIAAQTHMAAQAPATFGTAVAGWPHLALNASSPEPAAKRQRAAHQPDGCASPSKAPSPARRQVQRRPDALCRPDRQRRAGDDVHRPAHVVRRPAALNSPHQRHLRARLARRRRRAVRRHPHGLPRSSGPRADANRPTLARLSPSTGIVVPQGNATRSSDSVDRVGAVESLVWKRKSLA